MPSPQQQKELDERTQRKQRIKDNYQALTTNPAMVDLLTYLDAAYRLYDYQAKQELDNPTKALMYLQHASAYEKVKTYITDMMR